MITAISLLKCYCEMESVPECDKVGFRQAIRVLEAAARRWQEEEEVAVLSRYVCPNCPFLLKPPTPGYFWTKAERAGLKALGFLVKDAAERGTHIQTVFMKRAVLAYVYAARKVKGVGR